FASAPSQGTELGLQRSWITLNANPTGESWDRSICPTRNVPRAPSCPHRERADAPLQLPYVLPLQPAVLSARERRGTSNSILLHSCDSPVTVRDVLVCT